MNYIIKASSVIICIFVLQGCIIQNAKREDCEEIEITVDKIYEGGVKDIVFSNANGEIFYINRGLEQGHTLQEMKNKVLNKKVTLHLAKIITGTSSNHIAQMSLGQEVIYTEFE